MAVDFSCLVVDSLFCSAVLSLFPSRRRGIDELMNDFSHHHLDRGDDGVCRSDNYGGRMVMMAEKTKMMNDDARRVEPSDLEMGDWRLRCGDGYDDDDEKRKIKIEDDE